MFAFIFGFPEPSFAAFECMSEVKYSWEYTPPSPEMDEDKKRRKDPPPAVEKEKYEVPFLTRRLQGETEDLAKQKFEAVLDEDRSDAMAECKEVHENLSGCVAAKFMQMGQVLRQLDFNARKELEGSIVEDCRMSTGRCLKAEASKVTCREVIEPAVPESEGEGEEEGDKKKKKKK